MKKALGLAATLLTVLNCVQAAIIGQWNFNSVPPDGDANTGTNTPSAGSGTAALAGGTTGRYYGGDQTHDPAGSTDNSGWSTSKYPAASSNNLSAGVRFDADTTGFENISVSWYQYNSATASRYARFQYTLDGISFINAEVIAIVADSVFTSKTVNLNAVPGVANNPAFGFRIVAEFESSATGSGADSYAATKDGSAYGTAGTIRFDMVTVSGTPPPDGNTPPYVFAGIPSQTLRPGQSTGPLSFTVLDAESPASSLTLTPASSSSTVIPKANITFGGAGANRTVAVQAASQPGASLITVWVSDPGGKSNSMGFAVTVLPSNTAPVISAIPHTNTLMNAATPTIAFTIGDAETPATSLTLSGSSANPALVPNSPANIGFGGTGSNRTVTITPAAGQTGVAPITLTVSDGTNTASSAFAVMVTPSANVIFYEPFTYGDGSILTNSAFLWANRTGTDGECQTTNHQLLVTATQTEDVAGPLIGSPYETGNHLVLYAAFKANFLALPKRSPGLFAHFANGSTLRGRVYGGTTNAAPGCFQLQVANGSDTWTSLATDLTTNTTYTVVTRYDLDAAATTLWLNPAAESDPAVTATDPQTASRITGYDFRQDTDIGASILIDDLKVGLSFAAVVSDATVSPIPLTLEHSGSQLILRWTNPAFSLQAAPSVSAAFTNVPNAASPFTNPISGPQKFFRLKAN